MLVQSPPFCSMGALAQASPWLFFSFFNREGGILGVPYQPRSFNTRSLWLPNAGSGVASMDGMLARPLLNRAVEWVNLTHLFA